MSEVSETGYKRVSNIFADLEDQTGQIVVFDGVKIQNFITKVGECKTVRKVIDSTNIDELNEVLQLIDIYFNSAILKNKIDNIFQSVNSNFPMDYFKEMLTVCSFKEDEGGDK